MEDNTAVARLKDAQGAAKEVAQEMAETLLSYGIDPNRYANMMMEALSCTPSVANCVPHSIKKAVRTCCSMGMIPDGRQSVIVPFKDSRNGTTLATFIPMKLGMQMAVHETTGGIIRSEVVYEQDEFEYSEGLGQPHFKHARCMRPNIKEPNEIIAAWAAITLGDNTVLRVLTYPELDEARRKGLARSPNGPWKTFPAAMYEKTAVKRLINRNEYLIRAAIQNGNQGLQSRMTAIVDHNDEEDLEIPDITNLDDDVPEVPEVPSEEEVKTVEPTEVQDPPKEKEKPAPRKQRRAPAKQAAETAPPPPPPPAEEEEPPPPPAEEEEPPPPPAEEEEPPPPLDEAPGSFGSLWVGSAGEETEPGDDEDDDDGDDPTQL